MRLYDCTVRLNGSLLNTVRRKGVTAPEIALLRWMHSRSENANEPVINIVQVGAVKRSEREERTRLAEFYTNGEEGGPALVARVLGVEGVPLPQYVAGFDEPTVSDEPEVELPVRTRVKPDIKNRNPDGTIKSAKDKDADAEATAA